MGISIRNKSLLESALIHPSYRNEHPTAALEDFDRLEFFGDSLLNLIVCRKLYQKFPEANEGLLSRLRSILVSRKILFRVACELGLWRHLKLGRSLKQQAGFTKAKILADSFEALLASLYFDRGFAQAERFILEHFGSYFDAKRLFRLDPNPKSTLQELSQKEWQKIPTYSHILTPRGIKSEVHIARIGKAVGLARTRREAEEKAARFLLRRLRQALLRRSKKSSSGGKLRKIF